MNVAAHHSMIGGGAKIKLLSWIRPSSYTNYIATDFVFQPLNMSATLDYGIENPVTGYNIGPLFSESSTNLTGSQLTSGGKLFGALARPFSDGAFLLTAQSSYSCYAQQWVTTYLDRTTDPSDIKFNSIDITFNSPWNPSMLINGQPSVASTIGNKNRTTSSAYANYGIVFFAHRNGNGGIVTISANSDWAIPHYYLRGCKFKSISSGETLAYFKAAMDKSGNVGLFDEVTKNFYPSTNGIPLYGL